MKRSAECDSEKLREVFNNTYWGNPASTLVSFQEIESSMCKRRRKLLPHLPKDIQDFCQLIVESPYSHLYKASVNINGVILAPDFMLEKLKVAQQIQFDGTFYRVSRLFTSYSQFSYRLIDKLFLLLYFDAK